MSIESITGRTQVTTNAAQSAAPTQENGQTQQTPQRVPAYLPYMLAMGKMLESLRAESAGLRKKYETGKPMAQPASKKGSPTSTIVMDFTGNPKAEKVQEKKIADAPATDAEMQALCKPGEVMC